VKLNWTHQYAEGYTCCRQKTIERPFLETATWWEYYWVSWCTFSKRLYGIGGIFKSLARYAIPLFKQSAKVVGKRALQAATEVGQDVLRGRNVRESAKTHGREVVKDFAEKGARTLLRQTGHGSKRRRSQCSNLSSVKKQNLEDPRRTKWIREDESSHDESSHDDESDSETSQTSDDMY
jgi:hypothetical protein